MRGPISIGMAAQEHDRERPGQERIEANAQLRRTLLETIERGPNHRGRDQIAREHADGRRRALGLEGMTLVRLSTGPSPMPSGEASFTRRPAPVQ